MVKMHLHGFLHIRAGTAYRAAPAFLSKLNVRDMVRNNDLKPSADLHVLYQLVVLEVDIHRECGHGFVYIFGPICGVFHGCREEKGNPVEPADFLNLIDQGFYLFFVCLLYTSAQKVYNISCRLNTLSIDGDEKDRSMEDPYTESPDKIFETKEFKESVQRAINRLSPDQQAVIRETYFSDEKKDASMNTVSRRLGMDVSRVRRLLNQAKRDLLYAPELRDYTMSRMQMDLEDYTCLLYTS